MRKKQLITILLSTVIVTALLLPTNVFANVFVFNFKEFLLNENNIAENYLDFKSTREITVNAPQKYIEQVEVIHKKGNSLAETDISITNVDILTDGEDVSFINMFVNGNRRTINQPFSIDGTKKKFEIGYAGLNDNFDIRIEVISVNNETLEIMNFKVPEGSSNIFRINQKFTYKTSGKKYTLYDLLAGRNVFTDLLVEHRIQDIDAEFKLD